MKKYLLIAAAAMTVFAACSKEKELAAPEITQLPGWTYIGAQNGEEVPTSASVDGSTAAFTWNTGDKVAVWSGSTYYVSAPLESTYDGTNSAIFAFEGEINDGRSNFAVFPSYLVHDGTSVLSGSANHHDADNITITLPSSYTLAQVQDEVSPTPMIAVNTPGNGLAFKSICALVRITVKNVAWDAKSIKVRFPGQRVHGDFALENFVAGDNTHGGVNGEASTTEAEETITITDLNLNDTYAEQLVINIPVPMGTFTDVVTGAYDASGLIINYIVTPVKVVSDVPASWSPGRKSRRTVTANLPVFTISGSSIAAADRRMVIFAPGNLRAKLDTVPGPYIKDGAATANCRPICFGTADEWRFADHQYDAIGTYIPNDNERTKPVNTFVGGKSGDYVDLFVFQGDDNITNMTLGVGYQFGIYYGGSSGWQSYLGTDGSTLKHDWGENEIVYGDFTYESNTWRTPSFSEWRHVLERRKYNSNYISHATKATLTTGGNVVAYGLIILPDHYSHPYGVAALNKVFSQDNQSYLASEGGASESDNVIALEDWAKMEDAGCVFLPLTNMRSWDSTNLEPILNNAGVGLYWSSSPRSGKYATAMGFNCPSGGRDAAIGTNAGTSSLTSGYQRDRYYGCGVRLVRDVN